MEKLIQKENIYQKKRKILSDLTNNIDLLQSNSFFLN